MRLSVIARAIITRDGGGIQTHCAYRGGPNLQIAVAL